MEDYIKALEEYIKTNDKLSEELDLLDKLMTNHEINQMVEKLITEYVTI